jgi:DnaA family protein
MSSQLPLALRWPAQQRFDTYVAGGNSVAMALLRDAAESAGSPWVFLAGASGCGKTHLLIAACAKADAAGHSAQYLPLRRLRADAANATRAADQDRASHPDIASALGASHPDIASALRALGGSDVLALDDIDAVAGDAAAEHALFDLYNRCKVDKSTMLFSAVAAPGQIGIGLPDLVSRLSACAQGVLKPLSDMDRREALRQRAQARGLTLDDGVLDWLFARTQRDLGSLTALLDRLDRESLAAQRRITVPFLRRLFAATEPRD